MKRFFDRATHLSGLAFRGWRDDNCMSMGAALAFYSLLSMAPLMVLVISLAGIVIGPDEAQEVLLTQLAGLLGPTGAEGVKTVLSRASHNDSGLLQTLVSFGVLVLGATTVFGELQDDLNRIWRCTDERASGVWAMLRKRVLSFGLIAGIGFLLLTSLAVSAALTYMGSWFGDEATVARLLEMIASLVVMTGLFGLIYKVLPNCHIAWRDVAVGAFITALLFSIGKYLIGLYIGSSAIASDFGAAGTVVVAIVWVYYSSQIFFLGAEFTRAWAVRNATPAAAANSDYRSEPAEMIEVAKRIVSGAKPEGAT